MDPWITGAMLATMTGVIGLVGCDFNEDRADCDRALAVACACASRPCDQSTPPSYITEL